MKNSQSINLVYNKNLILNYKIKDKIIYKNIKNIKYLTNLEYNINKSNLFFETNDIYSYYILNKDLGFNFLNIKV